jgi:phage tail-like protein
MSPDRARRYVNLRRYLAYLEHSIAGGIQWAVFEPNSEPLWARVRRTIEDFLFNEWQNGKLLGDKPQAAYFVKCHRSTMTQNDLDNGRLVCLVGVATLRPAEFVIIRIGQWTAEHKGSTHESPMATLRDPPYAQFNFLVDLGDAASEGPHAAFQEVSGIGAEVTTSEYRKGSDKENRVKKIGGMTKPTDVTLKRGLIGSLDLYQWLDQSHDGDRSAIRTVTIHVRNEDRTAIVTTWKLLGARIIKHTSGPLNAKGPDVAIEELVLACEGLERE